MAQNQAGIRTKAGRFRNGHSGNEAGRPPARTDAADLAARTAPLASLMPHIDAWINTTTGLGLASKDKTVGAYFDVDTVSAEDALIMWRGEPMAARIIETIPNECIRQGVDI